MYRVIGFCRPRSWKDRVVKGSPAASSTPISVGRFWLAVWCGYSSLGATSQVQPEFLVHRFRASPFVVGAAISLASLAAALMRPFAGRAADNGLGRHVVMLGGACGVLGGVGQWWSPTLSVLLLSRLVMGAAEGALFTGAITLVLRTCEPEKRGSLAGWFGLSMWAGLCTGPALAAWVAQISRDTTAVWLLVIVLPFIGLVLVSTTATASPAVASTHRQLHRVLMPKGARLPGVAFFLTSYGYGSINSLLILYLVNRHLGGEGIVLSLFAAFFLITRALGSPLVNRLGGRATLLFCILIEVVGLCFIALPRLAVILAGAALAGIGVSMLYPAFVFLVVQRVPLAQHGVAVGFMTSFWDMGLVAGGTLGGLVISRGDFPVAFEVAAFLATLSLLIVLIPLSKGADQ